jgi:hypothetical protein
MGDPFSKKNLILDPEVSNLVSHITQLAKSQQVFSEIGRSPKASPWLPFVLEI